MRLNVVQVGAPQPVKARRQMRAFHETKRTRPRRCRVRIPPGTVFLYAVFYASRLTPTNPYICDIT